MWRELLCSGFETCFGPTHPSKVHLGQKTHLKSKSLRHFPKRKGSDVVLCDRRADFLEDGDVPAVNLPAESFAKLFNAVAQGVVWREALAVQHHVARRAC